jgi:hypothetical protein
MHEDSRAGYLSVSDDTPPLRAQLLYPAVCKVLEQFITVRRASQSTMQLRKRLLQRLFAPSNANHILDHSLILRRKNAGHLHAPKKVDSPQP